MIYGTSPAAGTVVRDLGHGVTVVHRDPPPMPGSAWVGGYAVNCATHGWIESRRTVQECADDGYSHIARDHRVWDDARKAQGFRSQAHLDAFYRASDHQRECTGCGPGPAMWLEGSASWQPAMRLCATGRQLEQESFAHLRA